MNRLLQSILFYEIRLPQFKSRKRTILDWLNSRKPLSQRIKEYNKRQNNT